MNLELCKIDSWPKLAWVARIRSDLPTVLVFHGPMVEVRDDWCVEAVWAGAFEDGDFDRTDLIFGSGVRIRDGKVVFVSSGTVFDRLWRTSTGTGHYVSNSLPALMASAGLSLRDDYLDYSQNIRTISKGLDNRIPAIPLQSGEAVATYFNNLIYDGLALREEPKCDPAPEFRTYDDYYQYLVQTAELLGANLSDPARKHKVVPLSGISSGYDSCAAAVISRHAGCTKTVTIKDPASFWRGSDSGAPVASRLGMECREYPRKARNYPLEASIWAAAGRAGILSWALFDFPKPLCLFFTGWHGEKMWDRVSHDHVDPFIRRDPGALDFCEYRLIKGVFQCPVPFWAARHNHETRDITLSDEMAPWYTNKDYDKPIARRIIEEAGVPGNLFGTLKKNTSHEEPFRWPYSPDARASFAEYLRKRGMRAPSAGMVRMLRTANTADVLIHRNLLAKVGMRRRKWPWRRVRASSFVFHWANEELKTRYEDGVQACRESIQ